MSTWPAACSPCSAAHTPSAPARTPSIFTPPLSISPPSDRLNCPPRGGLAWPAMPRLVVRSAYGFFYNHTNRQGREGLLAENPPYVRDLTRTQGPGSTQVITLDSGPPPNYFAAARPSDQVVRGDDPNLRNGRVQQWNLTVQYSFAPDWLFEVGYVGNHGTGLT